MFNERNELFAPEEIAQAAGVSERRVIDALGGTSGFLPADDAVALASELSQSAYFSTVDGRRRDAFATIPIAVSGTAHLTLVTALALLLAAGPTTEARPAAEPVVSGTRLVFLNLPGPGGGGGGGGRRQAPPPRRALNAGRQAMKSPAPAVAKPIEITPATPPPLVAEPMPQVLAPVVPMPGDPQSRNGAVERAEERDSLGPGDGGIAGGGRGSGVGNGQGSGIDDGSGGGTGGGPFRIGAGIQPPRIIREVKPLYSDEARRLGVAGEVLLDVVVQRDGRVGTVRLLRGLRPDLNERAIEAVRQWIFSPATRNGSPVDVLVEVAVEFNIR